jgi:peptidoglycan hydrolase-like protein with peptidoglycan-binding domain
MKRQQRWLRIVGAIVVGMTAFATPALAQTVTRPVVRLGSQGTEVAELQAALRLLGFFPGGAVDGVFSDSTALAVSRFQQSAGLQPDGVVGNQTWNRLFPGGTGEVVRPTERIPEGSPEPVRERPQPVAARPDPYPILRRGSRGAAVLGLQERLRAVGVLGSAADGVFGAETESAVKAAQEQFKLEPDGVVGPATWDALLR